MLTLPQIVFWSRRQGSQAGKVACTSKRELLFLPALDYIEPDQQYDPMVTVTEPGIYGDSHSTKYQWRKSQSQVSMLVDHDSDVFSQSPPPPPPSWAALSSTDQPKSCYSVESMQTVAIALSCSASSSFNAMTAGIAQAVALECFTSSSLKASCWVSVATCLWASAMLKEERPVGWVASCCMRLCRSSRSRSLRSKLALSTALVPCSWLSLQQQEEDEMGNKRSSLKIYGGPGGPHHSIASKFVFLSQPMSTRESRQEKKKGRNTSLKGAGSDCQRSQTT